MRWSLTFFRALLTILLAHALAFCLMQVLPDAAVIALGIESNNAALVDVFNATTGNRTYPVVLLDLSRGDLGRSIDGLPVIDELLRSIWASTPRYCLAFAGALFLPAGLCVLMKERGWLERGALPFIGFLPPYVVPFIALALISALALGTTGIALSDAARMFVVTVTLAIPPFALAAKQAGEVMNRNLATDYARALIAIGATPLQQRQQLLANLCYELLPSLQKMAVVMLGVLLFVEPLFGVSGFGTTALRAIRRSDVNLMLGVVLFAATFTVSVNLIGRFVRHRLFRRPLV